MGIQKIDHVAIAVADFEKSIAYHRDVLQLPFHGVEAIAYLNVEVAFFSCGDTEIELVHATSPESKVHRFIEKNGEGLYHLAFQVDSVAKAMEEYTAKGVVLRDKAPKPGANGSMVAFLDENSTGGVITELVQRDVFVVG